MTNKKRPTRLHEDPELKRSISAGALSRPISGPELSGVGAVELYQRAACCVVGAKLLTFGVMFYGLSETIQQHAVVGRILKGMFVVLLLRAVCAALVWRSANLRVRMWTYIGGSTLTALGLAFFNVVSYPLLAPTDVALVALMDAGICSVALISMGSSFLAYLLFMIPNLGSLSLIVAFGVQARWTHSLLILSMIYLGALFVLSLQQAMFHRKELILRMELAELSLRDSLTRLRNRRALTEFMSVEVEQIRRSWRGVGDPVRRKPPTSLGILMIDMDHFKSVNDTHGHAAGDAVLVQLAMVLSEAVRKADLVVRWGGAGLVIVARETDRASSSILVERIRQRVEAHLFLLPSGEIIRRTCSIGYSVFPFAESTPDLLTWEQVTAIADAGMYRAKTHGRNRGVGILSGERIDANSDVPNLLEQGTDHAVQLGLVRLVDEPGEYEGVVYPATATCVCRRNACTSHAIAVSAAPPMNAHSPRPKCHNTVAIAAPSTPPTPELNPYNRLCPATARRQREVVGHQAHAASLEHRKAEGMRELRGEHDRERIRIQGSHGPARCADQQAPRQQSRCANAPDESGSEPEHHDLGNHTRCPQDADRKPIVVVILQVQGEEHVERAEAGLREQRDQQEAAHAGTLP